MTDQIFFTDVTTAGAATDFFVTYLIMKHSFEFHALLNCVAENWLLFDAYQTIINFKELGRRSLHTWLGQNGGLFHAFFPFIVY